MLSMLVYGFNCKSIKSIQTMKQINTKYLIRTGTHFMVKKVNNY